MFNQIDPDELWLAFSVGSNFRYILVHEVARKMDPKNYAVSVNDARKQLFTQKSLKLKNLWPTQTSLVKHI